MVGNDEDSPLELLQCDGEGVQRLVVEIVGRLIQRDHVGACPHGRCEHQPTLLPPRHALDPSGLRQTVRDAKGSKMLEDLLLRARPDLHAALQRLHLGVVVEHQLHDVGVLALQAANRLPKGVLRLVPGALGLVAQLPTADGTPNDVTNIPLLRSQQFLLVRQLHRLHLAKLLVLPRVEPVLHVSHGRHLEMFLQVMHRVLRNVRYTQVVVLDDLSRVQSRPLIMGHVADESA
mmetsp:Transcript_12152/g.23966  ORF Transcript_12152/g.23966 Transcript_12152/m.23966 type:complete len:233 (-) Transcript_12152:1118-1816(-)